MKDKKKAEILEEVGKLIKKAGSHKPETPLRAPYTHPPAAELRKKWRLVDGCLVEVKPKKSKPEQ